MTFGQKLQEIHKATGLSQEQLAEALGMSRQAISKWETGESVPDVDKLKTICGVFNISADELIGIDVKAADEKDGETKSGERHDILDYVNYNMRRRIFTAGWITALIGVVALMGEYMALFFIRDSWVKVSAEYGMGFYKDAMMYATIEPMPTVFLITRVVIIAGVIIALLSLLMPKIIKWGKKRVNIISKHNTIS